MRDLRCAIFVFVLLIMASMTEASEFEASNCTCYFSSTDLGNVAFLMNETLTNGGLTIQPQTSNGICGTFLKVISTEIVFIRKILPLKLEKIEDYETLNEQIKIKLDGMKSIITVIYDYADQASKDQIEEMQKIFGQFVNNTNAEMLVMILKYCEFEIAKGNFKKAVDIFVTIEEKKRFLEEIIKNLYGQNADNAENILKFMYHLTNSEEIYHCIKFLYDEMAINDQLNRWETIFLLNQVKKLFENTDSKNFNSSVQDDLKKMKNILTLVSDSIYCNKDVLEKSVKNIQNHIYYLIGDGSLGKTELKESISSISRFENSNLVHISLEFLMKNIPSDHQDIFKIAFLAKSYSSAIFKSNFTENIQQILTNRVCIRHILHNSEYLYASKFNETGKRSVFTWRNVSTTFPCPQCEWQFETLNKGATFKIKNVHYNEYLFPSSNGEAHDTDRRNIFTWMEKGEIPEKSDFIIETRKNYQEFRLKSSQFNEYMYADFSQYAKDPQRRRVFTWRPGGYTDDDYWMITKCPKN